MGRRIYKGPVSPDTKTLVDGRVPVMAESTQRQDIGYVPPLGRTALTATLAGRKTVLTRGLASLVTHLFIVR